MKFGAGGMDKFAQLPKIKRDVIAEIYSLITKETDTNRIKGFTNLINDQGLDIQKLNNTYYLI